MNRSLPNVMLLTIMIVLPVLFSATSTCAGNKSAENQVVKILVEEAANNKIAVGVLDFRISSINTEMKVPYDQLKLIENGLAVEFTSQLMNAAKDSRIRNKISIIERSMLNEILQEQKLQATGITEQTIAEIGGIQGLDVIIMGSVLLGRNNAAEIVPIPVHEVLYKFVLAAETKGYSHDQIVRSLPQSKVDPLTAKWAQSAIDAGYDIEDIFTAFKKAGVGMKRTGMTDRLQYDVKGLSASLLMGGPTYFIKTVKVVRVKDGKVLGIAEEEKGLFKKN